MKIIFALKESKVEVIIIINFKVMLLYNITHKLDNIEIH